MKQMPVDTTKTRAVLLVLFAGLSLVWTPSEVQAQPAGRLLSIPIFGGQIRKGEGIETADGFGTLAQFLDGTPQLDFFLVGAPGGSEGVGRLDVMSTQAGAIGSRWTTVSSLSGKELTGNPVEGLGRSSALLTLDGIPSVAVGAPTLARAGSPSAAVVVLDMVEEQTLVERYRLEADAETRFGWSMESTISGAIFPDLLVVGAPTQRRGKRLAGAVHGIDHSTGERLWSLRAKRRYRHFGYSLERFGSGSVENRPVFVVGAPGNGKKRTPGTVFFVSASGKVLRKLSTPNRARLFGTSLVTTRTVDFQDLDGDTISDILVGSPGTKTRAGKNTGAVYAFSGADGSLLWSLEGTEKNQFFGVDVLLVGSQTGGRFLAVSSLFAAAGNTGAVHIFDLDNDNELLSETFGEPGERLGSPLPNVEFTRGDFRALAGSHSDLDSFLLP